MRVDLSSDRPWRRVSVELPAVPTMISSEERQYLYWLGRDVWSGAGRVLEMGPWLGGSTVALAAGLRDGPHDATGSFHVYDSFVWREFMAARAPLPLADGESFQPWFERNIAPYRDIVVASRRSLPDEQVVDDPLACAVRDVETREDELLRWDPEDPLEIVFVDGAKSWLGMRHLMAEAAPALLPGRSVVVCQDYKSWGCYWVPLTIELLADRFELVHVLAANTVAFRLVAALDREAVEALPAPAQLTAGRGLALLDAAAARLRGCGDAGGAAIVELAAVRFLGNVGALDRARTAFRESERRWPVGVPLKNLEATRAWLADATRRPVPVAPCYLLRSLPGRWRYEVRPRLRRLAGHAWHRALATSRRIL